MIGKVNIASTYREDVDGWIENRRVSSIDSNDRHSQIGPEELARKWNVGIQTANDNLDVPKKHGVSTAVQPMTIRLRVDHLHLHRPLLRGTWFADTLMSKVKSIRGNQCANIFTQGKFIKFVPMMASSESGQSLVNFTDDVGIPEHLVTDGAGEFTGRVTEFVKEARRMRIRLHTSEQGRKNQNQSVERKIGFLAKRWRDCMHKKKLPKRLWDFGLLYESELLSRMACGRDHRTGYEEVTGDNADISEWIYFEIYDLVYWIERPNKPDTSDNVRSIDRWLGMSHRVRSDMCYWLITDSGKLVSKTSVEYVICDDYLNPEFKKQIDEFNDKIDKRLDKTKFTLLILTMTMTITTKALSQARVLILLMMNTVICSPTTDQKQMTKKLSISI